MSQVPLVAVPPSESSESLCSQYPAIGLSLAAGSYTMATYLTSTVYERAKARHAIPDGERCTYADCFTLTYCASAGACLVGAALSLELTRRTRPLYRALHLASNQH